MCRPSGATEPSGRAGGRCPPPGLRVTPPRSRAGDHRRACI